MLASGSLANASSAAARIAWTLRSASDAAAPLRSGGCRLLRHLSARASRAGLRRSFGTKSRACGSTAKATQARETSQDPGCHERVGDPRGGLGAAECSGAPAAIVENTAIPIVPPISWPVELRPEIIPDSSSRGAGQDRDRHRDDGDPEPEAGDEHPGQHVARGSVPFSPTCARRAIPTAAIANADARGIRTPWRPTMCPAPCAPIPAASASGMNARPVISGPVPSTFWR